MLFRKVEGKQVLDLSGDFILTHSDHLLNAVSKSAAPHRVVNATYVSRVGKLTFKQKLKASQLALAFIWSNR